MKNEIAITNFEGIVEYHNADLVQSISHFPEHTIGVEVCPGKTIVYDCNRHPIVCTKEMPVDLKKRIDEVLRK